MFSRSHILLIMIGIQLLWAAIYRCCTSGVHEPVAISKITYQFFKLKDYLALTAGD